MKRRPILALALPLLLAAGTFFFVKAAEETPKPLRVLLVTGGCCHDYEQQRLILAEGISARANVEVTFAHNPDTKTTCTFDIYKDKDWAKPYDVIIHDECSADVTDPEYVGNIIAAHRNGTPAVNLHCAMHSYRWGNFREPVTPGADNAHWYEMIGLQSTRHDWKKPITIDFVEADHPIVKGMTSWTTIDEELYNNVSVMGARTLAKGRQMQKNKETGVEAEAEAIVAWTNEFGPNKTRIFSTSLGHQTETVADARYLDLVTRGVLWAAGKLGEDGKPVAGYEAPKQ